tara:strand:+ start:869 stop:1735 length:867 start_codon:yes stop_codon:yes gene_type:complete
VLAIDGKIIVKIENEIITNLDIDNEKIYLSILNPNLSKIDKQSLYVIAKNSLIREKIKLAEISKYKLNKIDDKYLENVIESIYLKIGINNREEFINYIKSYGLSLPTIKEKLTYEALWNQLIYQKYFSKLKIDVNKIKNDILSKKNTSKSYLLSEILYSVDKKDERRKVEKKIYESIKKNGFENTASIFSISKTSKTGGKLGWIDEGSINEEIKQQIIKLKIGEITKPIVVPGGFLILKIENKKEIENKIDINTELEKRIVFLQNTQLNQFSNIYFTKIKKDFLIDEK